ncbi:MAG: hypothetical protein Q8P08_02050 [bacterium]|nr:hypothetical protein [bacterium]
MGREAKTETTALKRIDIRSLNHGGLFSGWNTATVTWASHRGEEGDTASVDFLPGGRHISLSCEFQNFSDGNLEQSVPLDTTPCFFGGSRYWFFCPLCNHRVAVLYLENNHFGCRHCYNLTYASRNEKRGSFCYPFVRALQLEEKIGKLMPAMKRWQYAGKATKKLKKLQKLHRKFLHFSSSILEENGV